jgi:hypothetical protein
LHTNHKKKQGIRMGDHGMSNNNNNNTPQGGQGGGSPNQGNPYPESYAFRGPPMYGSPHHRMYEMPPYHMSGQMMPLPPGFAPPMPAVQTMYSRSEVSHSFDCAVNQEVLKSAIQGSTTNGVFHETTAYGRSLVIPTIDDKGKKIGVIYTATSTGILGITDDGIVVDGKMYEPMGVMCNDQEELLDKKPPLTIQELPESTKRPSAIIEKASTTNRQKKKKKRKFELQPYRHQTMPYKKDTRTERAKAAYDAINRMKFCADQAPYKQVMMMIKTKQTPDLTPEGKATQSKCASGLVDEDGNGPLYARYGGKGDKLQHVVFRELSCDLHDPMIWAFENLQGILEDEGRSVVTLQDTERVYRRFVRDCMFNASIPTDEFLTKISPKKNQKFFPMIENFLPDDLPNFEEEHEDTSESEENMLE